jgi:hypothetical protein
MMATQCKDWQAWLDKMPPKPDELHVTGDVMVGNPGVQPTLAMRNPQGLNPAILILDLYLVQQPGMWPQVMTCASVRFDRVLPPGATDYTSVEIYSDGEQIAQVDVSIVE